MGSRPMGGVKMLARFPHIWGLVAVVFVAAVAYMVIPGMLAGITGSGCV